MSCGVLERRSIGCCFMNLFGIYLIKNRRVLHYIKHIAVPDIEKYLVDIEKNMILNLENGRNTLMYDLK